MMFRIVILTVLFVGIAHAEVYKYTNKQGKISYSDTPTVGSKKIIVPPVMTYKAPVIPIQSPVTVKNSISSKHLFYQQLQITSPAEQEPIRSNQGSVSVAYSLEPSLKEGDRVSLSLDGVPQQSFNLEFLSRGKHVIRVFVLNKNGEELISSQNVSFYLLRHSVN